MPPYSDVEYRRLRGALTLPEKDGILDLDGRFGLHPALAPLQALYRAGEMTALHAVATPYRSRSWSSAWRSPWGNVRPQGWHLSGPYSPRRWQY